MMSFNKKLLGLFVAGLLLIYSGFLLGKTSDNQQSNSSLKVSPTNSARKEVEDTTLKISPKINQEVFVKKVIDGDTVETDKGEKIRYLGINAPEKGQPFSSESTQKNSDLVLNKSIELEFDVQTKDRYGRTLAYVFINGDFINLEMVKNGLAVSETIQPNVKYQEQILAAQKEARENCLGIWKGICKPNSDSSKSHGCVQIASINADAPGDDNKNKNEEWIELKNTCSEDVPMKDWLLKDSSASNKYEFKTFTFMANESIIIYSGCGQDSNNKLYWQCPEGKYAIWNNTSDHAYLYNNNGELVSDYEY